MRDHVPSNDVGDDDDNDDNIDNERWNVINGMIRHYAFWICKFKMNG